MRRVTTIVAYLASIATLASMSVTAQALPATSKSASPAGPPAAQSVPQPIADFNFNQAPVGSSFTGGGAKAEVHGTADLVAGQAGQGTAAQLGSGFWMDVTKSDGSALLKGKDDFTISYDSKSNQTGAAWTFFAAPSHDTVNGDSPTYIGVLDQTNKTRLERYKDGRGGDVATIDQNAGTADNWKHVDIVVHGTLAKLYVNHNFIAANANGKKASEIFGADGGVLQVGKGNWGGGEYFTGQLDNLKIYDQALSSADLGVAQPTGVTIAGTGIVDNKLTLKQGTTEGLSARFQPAGVEQPEVVWSSDNPAVASVAANGDVTAHVEGTATITVADKDNAALSANVKITVQSVSSNDPYGYVMVHFLENANGYSEKIYLDISRGDNPEQWDPLNGGEPILASNDSTTGVRDPFIAYNPESKTYYILATDLRVFGADNANWGTWSNDYSTKLHVWQTKDLIHFSPMSAFDTGADTSGNKLTQFTDAVTGNTITQLGMAWAPEATWVPDFYDLNDDGLDNGSATGGAFVVYWAANPRINGINRHNRVMWGYTSDFTQKTFHLGGVFVDTGGSTIDTTMLQKPISVGNPQRLRTYRMSKDNGTGKGIFMEATDQQAWWKATDWRMTQQSIGSSAWAAHPGGVEGPAGFKDHNTDKWYLYVDVIPSTGYRPMVSTDLDGAIPWTKLDTSGFYMTPSTKHGGIISLTRTQYDAIRSADAKASDNFGLDAGKVSVKQGVPAQDVVSALPKNQQINLADGYGKANRNVTWDVSQVNTAALGTYTVTGTVDTIGASLNHWRGDDDYASGWSNTGGFSAADGSRKLYSSTAIHVSAKVDVVKTQDGSSNPPSPSPSAPVESDLTDANHVSGLVVEKSVAAGSQVTLHAGQANASRRAEVYLFSSPRDLGEVTFDVEGDAVVQIPADASVDDHRVVVVFSNSVPGAVRLAWDWLKVSRSGQAGGSNQPGDTNKPGNANQPNGSHQAGSGSEKTGQTALSSTGSEIDLMIALTVALVLCAASMSLVRRKARR